MTMHTWVRIAQPCDPEKLFLHVLDILEADPDFAPTWDLPADADHVDPFSTSPGPLHRGRATYSHLLKGGERRFCGGVDAEVLRYADGSPLIVDESQYHTTIGQGLSSIWEVTYAEDGPLTEEDDEHVSTERNTVDRYDRWLLGCSMDTGYGYRGSAGAGCGDLHAYLLTEIGGWLGDNHVGDWQWQNEAGPWHGPNEIHRCGDVLADDSHGFFERAYDDD